MSLYIGRSLLPTICYLFNPDCNDSLISTQRYNHALAQRLYRCNTFARQYAYIHVHLSISFISIINPVLVIQELYRFSYRSPLPVMQIPSRHEKTPYLIRISVVCDRDINITPQRPGLNSKFLRHFHSRPYREFSQVQTNSERQLILP